MANEIDLEQSDKLKQENIVVRYIYYPANRSVEILLNHQYEQKTVVVSIRKDWNKTHDIFEKTLKRKGIEPKHITLLTDVIDDNHHVILSQEPEADASNNVHEQYYSFSCYYCPYGTNDKQDYEKHIILLKHPGKPAYPNKAEIEKQGLKPQDKSWET